MNNSKYLIPYLFFDKEIFKMDYMPLSEEEVKAYNEMLEKKTINTERILHAHWIKEDYWSEGYGMGEVYGYYYRCSNCGKVVRGFTKCEDKYCRECGAKMDE